MDEKSRSETLEKTIRRLEQENKALKLEIQAISEKIDGEGGGHAGKTKFQELVETSINWIYEMNKDGVYTYVSPQVKDILGYAPEEVLGKTIFDFLAPEDMARVAKTFSSLLQNPRPINFFQKKCLHKKGHEVTIESNGRPIIGPDGKLDGFRGIKWDISKRKQAEDALIESEEKYKQLSDATFEAIFLSKNGICTGQNKSAEKMFGYTAEEAIGRLGTDWIHPEYHSKVKQNIKSNNEKPYEVIAVRKDGSPFPCEIQGRMSVQGDKKFRITALRDISENKSLEAQLRQAQKMESIGTLAGGIAHDFNNILFPIIGHAELMIEDMSIADSHRLSLNEIRSSALRAKDLVSQILTFSRQDNIEVTHIDMQSVIQEALNLIRSTIPATIEIDQDIDEACGQVKASPTKIHQVVMNLSTNAFHAMEKDGGKLKISLNEVAFDQPDAEMKNLASGRYACLSVSDTGMGMEKEVVNKIFDPFFTTKGQGKGTGMGLSVVHGIVKSLGGIIQVHSNPGKGTSFSIYLPVVKHISKKIPHRADSFYQEGSERILLVDDDESVIKIEKQILDRLGYKTTLCLHSLEALEIFTASPDRFDLVITDMTMPKLSGDKLSGRLRKIRSDIPILICTGYNETLTEETLNALGINGVLMKPIVIRDFSRKIREVLDNMS